MPETSPGSQFHRFQHTTTTLREELIYLLACASEFEHKTACIYLFAAISLKSDRSEGGLSEEQAATVRHWRRQLAAIGIARMGHLAQISNILTAIGGTPHVTRPVFSGNASADRQEGVLTLEPFSQTLLDHLIEYESLDVVIRGTEQQKQSQWTPDKHGKDVLAEPFSTNFTTARELYDRITKGLRSMPSDELFIAPTSAQANPDSLDLHDQLLAVVDQESACQAIAQIIGSAKGSDAENSVTHVETLRTIQSEYQTTSAAAQQSGEAYNPVRPVGKNPRVYEDGDSIVGTRIVDQLTVAVADIFNFAYDTMLIMLQRFFAHAEESEADLERLAKASLRLMSSVIRPLGEALAKMPADSTTHPGICAGPPFGDRGELPDLLHLASAQTVLGERLWNLALEATQLRIQPGLPAEIQEATAALQDLSRQFSSVDGPHGVAARMAELQSIQAECGCTIQASLNGPYLVTNVENMVNWLGENIPVLPQMALCRCGNSSLKPFCDGTHARIDFTGQKDPKRVRDRRDSYEGTVITVLDNRGICAHSGFCTDRLSSVFHLGQEPFVSPNGARMDEIIRAVRSCPSGALSCAIGTVEARSSVDQVRPATIEVSKDGPYRITGGIELKDGQGNDEARNTGASLEHYSLCRCGHSQNKPFCSGMHWYVDFHDPKPVEDHEPTLFEWAGGLPAFRRMTHLFYEKYVPQDPLLQPLFAHMSPDHPERVASWLSEVFGGPKYYSENFGDYTRMLSQHVGKSLTEAQRGQWASLITKAANEAGLPADPEFRSAFASYIEWGSRLAVENSTAGAHPPPHMPIPRWDWGTAGAPGSRISALAPLPEKEEELVLPTENESVHFSEHIKPLFRQMDRNSMKWAFDLWAYEDVKQHANGILQRLKSGTMPCDGAWPQEKIAVFQRWIETGKQK